MGTAKFIIKSQGLMYAINQDDDYMGSKNWSHDLELFIDIRITRTEVGHK